EFHEVGVFSNIDSRGLGNNGTSQHHVPSPHSFDDVRERLKLLYQAKTETLESQVVSLRKELAESQKSCEDLKLRLKHQESLLEANCANRVSGMCIKCAQQEAVLAKTHANVHMQTIERLTKERDELMDALVTLRGT
ncbi:serologically defined colon cancer antigen 8 homolog, partial [Microcaecilia unicolor]|uniref:Serologically defined colon cancer antigen 8 homolog n=1 Tax=Microcaecilia unicolor TaxID=1415580 RepID=A0A6P7X529_9AMPH